MASAVGEYFSNLRAIGCPLESQIKALRTSLELPPLDDGAAHSDLLGRISVEVSDLHGESAGLWSQAMETSGLADILDICLSLYNGNDALLQSLSEAMEPLGYVPGAAPERQLQVQPIASSISAPAMMHTITAPSDSVYGDDLFVSPLKPSLSAHGQAHGQGQGHKATMGKGDEQADARTPDAKMIPAAQRSVAATDNQENTRCPARPAAGVEPILMTPPGAVMTNLSFKPTVPVSLRLEDPATPVLDCVLSDAGRAAITDAPCVALDLSSAAKPDPIPEASSLIDPNSSSLISNPTSLNSNNISNKRRNKHSAAAVDQDDDNNHDNMFPLMAAVEASELDVIPDYLRSQFSLSSLNAAISSINEHLTDKRFDPDMMADDESARDPSRITQGELKDVLGFGPKAKPLVLLLIHLRRIAAKKDKGSDQTYYSLISN